MKKALIGFSGLIGKNLLMQTNFDYKFNSKNINKIKKKKYDLVICAAAPGKMYLANKYPKQDKNKINKLINNLKKVETKKFVLISTIQVFKNIKAKNNEFSNQFNKKIAYGRHRRDLEIFCQKKFRNLIIVRLPSVFGPFLKKNFIFDLFNPIPMMLKKDKYNKILSHIPKIYRNNFKKYYDKKNSIFYLKKNFLKKNKPYKEIVNSLKKNNLQSSSFTNPVSSFQYYFLKNLWKDIFKILNKNIKIIHFACEPIKAKTIHKKLLNNNMKKNTSFIYNANMVSKYNKLWRSNNNYLYNKKTIIKQLLNFYKVKK